MIRINLLPHRAEKRRIRQIQFVVMSALSLLLGAVLVGAVHFSIGASISNQEARNRYLQQETALLDKQIAEIKMLREQTESLLARKNVVESLQSTRADVVHLLDQMLRILPDGVYMKNLKQTGYRISLTGYAQSNARVSTLMRAIEDSPWLDAPSLVEVHSVSVGGARLSEFSLTYNLTKGQNPNEAATQAAGKR